MSEPSKDETTALDDAGPLLRFAAEHVKDLDKNLSLTIATARDAAATKQWAPQISQQFWAAFNELCFLVQPVTMECLAAKTRSVEARSWFGRKLDNVPLPVRTSSRYMLLLLYLLAVTLALQLYVWTGTNLSAKIDDNFKTVRAQFA